MAEGPVVCLDSLLHLDPPLLKETLEKRLRELASERRQRAFCLLPEWTARFPEIMEAKLGLSGKNIGIFMSDLHSLLVYLDPGTAPVPYRALEEIAAL